MEHHELYWTCRETINGGVRRDLMRRLGGVPPVRQEDGRGESASDISWSLNHWACFRRVNLVRDGRVTPDISRCFWVFFFSWSNLRLGHDALIDPNMVGPQEAEAACLLLQTNHRMKLRSLDIIMIYNDLWHDERNKGTFSDTNFPDRWNSLPPTSGSFKAGLRCWFEGAKGIKQYQAAWRGFPMPGLILMGFTAADCCPTSSWVAQTARMLPELLRSPQIAAEFLQLKPSN